LRAKPSSNLRSSTFIVYFQKHNGFMTQESGHRNGDGPADQASVATKVHGDVAWNLATESSDLNFPILQELLSRVCDIHSVVLGKPIANQGLSQIETSCSLSHDEQAELADLRWEAETLRAKVADLKQQNQDLAAQVANRNMASSLGNGEAAASETLSWEDRKQIILRQMEQESFDAEAFAQSLGQDSPSGELDPREYVEQLHCEILRRDEDLEQRKEQIRELQCLLDQQSETRAGGIAIGAAAITSIIDSDELVREERERLQRMQDEWEEKFRQAEIDASLERAKLSRERQEVARKLADLEEQLAHAKRESRHSPTDEHPQSRRWLTKLGLTEGNP